MTEQVVLTYEEFVDQNYDELSVICAEEGLDRELDFDRDRWCEELFESAHSRGVGRGHAQLVWAKPLVLTQETYTFSRALHLMRYGSKYLQTTLDNQEMFRVISGELVRSIKVNGKWSPPYIISGLPHDYIMGSWVEVRL